MSERLQALNEKREKLVIKKEEIEKKIKEIDSKIKEIETASNLKELDETVIVLKDRGLDLKDILRSIRSGNMEEIQKLLTKENDDK